MEQTRLADRPAEKGRPLWGFCRTKIETVCSIWTAYREGRLERQDLQVWFGIHELLMRRCTVGPGRTPVFEPGELCPLTGKRVPQINASLRRLEGCGFVAWSRSQVVVKEGTPAFLKSLGGLPAMLRLIVNRRRTLPIPRHTILLLARTRRPVMMAAVLGHLFRCVYYRNRECLSWGTCKASDTAELFGVDIRNVKAVRAELLRVGWLRQLSSRHWHRQRYGGTFVVSLAWRSPTQSVSVPPPRNVLSTGKTPPPVTNKNLPSETINQNRVSALVTGVQGRRNSRTGKEPSLRDVQLTDLAEPKRLERLFEEAMHSGMVSGSEMSRLQFFAAAERARRLAWNPGGFFTKIVRDSLWKNLAHCDEDRARLVLARSREQQDHATHRERRRFVPGVRLPAIPVETDPQTIRDLIRQSLASTLPPDRVRPHTS